MLFGARTFFNFQKACLSRVPPFGFMLDITSPLLKSAIALSVLYSSLSIFEPSMARVPKSMLEDLSNFFSDFFLLINFLQTR